MASETTSKELPVYLHHRSRSASLRERFLSKAAKPTPCFGCHAVTIKHGPDSEPRCPVCLITWDIDAVRLVQKYIQDRGGIFACLERAMKSGPRGRDMIPYQYSVRRWHITKTRLLKDVADLAADGPHRNSPESEDMIQRALQLYKDKQDSLAVVPGYEMLPEGQLSESTPTRTGKPSQEQCKVTFSEQATVLLNTQANQKPMVTFTRRHNLHTDAEHHRGVQGKRKPPLPFNRKVPRTYKPGVWAVNVEMLADTSMRTISWEEVERLQQDTEGAVPVQPPTKSTETEQPQGLIPSER